MAKVRTRFSLGPVESEVKAKLRDNMAAAAHFLQARALDSLRRDDKSGRIYQRGTIVRRASAPGEPPARDTGRLQGALGSDVLVRAKEVIGVVFAQTDYARALELGTPKLKPRPFLRPALLNNKRQILSLLRRR